MALQEPDYEVTFREFWRDLVINKDGSVNLDQVKRELHDYRYVLKNVPLVYDHVTGGRVSKPNTDADAVIAEFDDRATEDAERYAREEIKEFVEWLADNYSIISWIEGGKDYLSMRLSPEEWFTEFTRRRNEQSSEYDPTDGTDMRSAHHKDVG